MKTINNLTIEDLIHLREAIKDETKISYYRPAGTTDEHIRMKGTFSCVIAGLQNVMVHLLKTIPEPLRKNMLDSFVENVQEELGGSEHEVD